MAEKVLFTASTFSHILNFHVPYLKWFQEHGWLVHVACGGAYAEIPYANRVFSLPLQKHMAAPQNVKAASQLRCLIREEKYTLISANTSLAAFFTRLALKGIKYRPRLVNIVHGFLFDDDTPALKRYALLTAERLMAPQTDLLLAMNAWDLRLAQSEKLGSQVAHIPGMGVDAAKLGPREPGDGARLRREWNIPNDAYILLYPAEFSKRKSQQILIEALAKLPDHCVLVLPGQGELHAKCRALAESMGLGGRVLFPGQVSGMGRWYAMADVSVAASRGEGLPFHVVEAMLCGLPVVASRVKGHIDLVEDGVSGLLYPYGDAEACAQALRLLMDAPALRSSFGCAGRKRAEAYVLSRVFEQVTACYAKLAPSLAAEEANDIGIDPMGDDYKPTPCPS